jgi:hypothetical protein
MKGKFCFERRFTMKTNRIRTLVMAALGLLAAAALVGTATAQSSTTACNGTFTLPNAVRWNGAVLPAGDYSFVLESASLPAKLLLRGPDGAKFLFSPGQSRRKDGERSFMAIERRQGSGYVRELYLAPIGVHFFYPVPKVPKDELLAQQTPTTEHVLVSIAGN